MSLPTGLDWSQAQTKWKSQIDPVLANPMNEVLILKNVSLLTGKNVINHLLGRPLQGWFLVRQKAPATIYDTQDSNQTPDKTLVLMSSAGVVVSIGVF